MVQDRDIVTIIYGRSI